MIERLLRTCNSKGFLSRTAPPFEVEGHELQVAHDILNGLASSLWHLIDCLQHACNFVASSHKILRRLFDLFQGPPKFGADMSRLSALLPCCSQRILHLLKDWCKDHRITIFMITTITQYSVLNSNKFSTFLFLLYTYIY